jgi:phosphohistidine phosphatase SixA
MQLFLGRHGRTASTNAGRLSAPDEALTKEGVAESERAAQNLQPQLGGKAVTRIITSPRVRTQETAAVIARVLGFTGSIELDA